MGAHPTCLGFASVFCVALLGCRSDKPSSKGAERGASSAAAAVPAVSAPQLARSPERPTILYLPDAGLGVAALPEPEVIGFWDRPIATGRRCPAEMVDVQAEFCIDRHEGGLRDRRTQRLLSPFYSASSEATRHWFKQGKLLQQGARTEQGRLLSVPEPPAYQLQGELTPEAVSVRGQLPNGYMSGQSAALACQTAGKRLCTPTEWRRACRGQGQTRYPYGNEYQYGACNVFRATHPAGVLHADPSIHHRDPRLNLVRDREGPLLRKTGELASCRSVFGGDAVFDMVGNLDEWVAGPPGLFLGGFYARATRDGCDAEVASHAFEYLDYSLGFRCCL